MVSVGLRRGVCRFFMAQRKRVEAFDDVFDFKSGASDSARLKAVFAKQFVAQSEPLADRIAFAKPYAPALRSNALMHRQHGIQLPVGA